MATTVTYNAQWPPSNLNPGSTGNLQPKGRSRCTPRTSRCSSARQVLGKLLLSWILLPTSMTHHCTEQRWGSLSRACLNKVHRQSNLRTPPIHQGADQRHLPSQSLSLLQRRWSKRCKYPCRHEGRRMWGWSCGINSSSTSWETEGVCGITLGGGKIKKKIAMRSVLYVPVTITLRCKQMSCHIPAICVAMIAMTTNRVVDNRLI